MVTYTERSLGPTGMTDRGALTSPVQTERGISTTVFTLVTIAVTALSACDEIAPVQYDNTAPIIMGLALVDNGYIDPETLEFISDWEFTFTTNRNGTTNIKWGLLPDPATWTYDELVDGAFVTSHVIDVSASMLNGAYFYYQAWSMSVDDLWGHSEVIGPVKIMVGG